MGWQSLDLLSHSKGNHDKIWFVHWRPQIELLMAGSSDNYVAALMLMIPCMERVYTLAHPQWDSYQRKKAGEKHKRLPIDFVLKWFFKNEGSDEYDQIIETVAQGFANGLKHDSFIRDEVRLWDGFVGRIQSGQTGNEIDSFIHAQRIRALIPIEGTDGHVSIAPHPFWTVVKHRIDKFYIEEYPGYKLRTKK